MLEAHESPQQAVYEEEKQLLLFVKYVKCKLQDKTFIIDNKTLDMEELAKDEVGATLAGSQIQEIVEDEDDIGLIIDLVNFRQKQNESILSNFERFKVYLKKLKNQGGLILILDHENCLLIKKYIDEVFSNDPFTNYLIKSVFSINSPRFSYVYLQKYNLKAKINPESCKVHTAEFLKSHQDGINKVADVLLSQYGEVANYFNSIKKAKQFTSHVILLKLYNIGKSRFNI